MPAVDKRHANVDWDVANDEGKLDPRGDWPQKLLAVLMDLRDGRGEPSNGVSMRRVLKLRAHLCAQRDNARNAGDARGFEIMALVIADYDKALIFFDTQTNNGGD